VNQSDEQEWDELHVILQSGVLGKSPNLLRFLEFIAEHHFSGSAEPLKEYVIAVQALKRPESFDPQTDAIVRVTAHALRKRLRDYYRGEGASHPVQMELPTGKYVLRFYRRDAQAIPPPEPSDGRESTMAHAEVSAPPATGPATPSSASARHPGKMLWVGMAVVLAAALAVTGVVLPRLHPAASAEMKPESRPKTVGNAPEALRFLAGEGKDPIVDTAGRSWAENRFCKGGSGFLNGSEMVNGTDDPSIFQQGRKGQFQCLIPVKPGAYQLQLLFADTDGNSENSRRNLYSINFGTVRDVDVVDEAGDRNMATGKVYAGIHPLADGAIHLDFLSEASFLNAVEVLPAPNDDPLPLRMVAGPAILRDDEGRIWDPERFFHAGRRTPHPAKLPKAPNSKIYASERYGHFYYSLPVAQDREYSLTMYFSEGWFGTMNKGPGGVGSRRFDVVCNGNTVLKDFDILKDSSDGTAVRTIRHLRPTAQGLLELYFTPITNYPTINAIEVYPEQSQHIQSP
jgi:hypothetical protein